MLAAATAESTYIVRMDFKDSDGDAKAPYTMTWSLKDENGRIVNSREDVNIAGPSTYEEIVLGADDLTLYGPGDGLRTFIAEGTYHSVEYGNNLPLTGSASFVVKAL